MSRPVCTTNIPFQPLPSVAKPQRAPRIDLSPRVREALNCLDTTLADFDESSFHQIDEVIGVFHQLKENQSHLETCLRAHARGKSPHHFVQTLRKWLCDLSGVLKHSPQLLQACSRSELETMALGLTACISLGQNNAFVTAVKKPELDAFLSLVASVFKNFSAITDDDPHDHAGCECNLHNLVSRLLKSGLISGKDEAMTGLRTLMKDLSRHFFESLRTWRGKPDADLSGLLSSAEKRSGKHDVDERIVKRAGKAMVQVETLCDATHQLLPLGGDDTGAANRAELIADLAWLGGARSIAAYARDHVNGEVALSSLAHLYTCLLKWGYLARDASSGELLGPLLNEIARAAACASRSSDTVNLRSLSNFCGLLKELTHRNQDALWDANSRPVLDSACHAVAGVLASLGPAQLDTATAVPMFAFLRALEAWQARPARNQDGHGHNVTTTSNTGNATVTTTTTTSTTASLSTARSATSTTTTIPTASQFAELLEQAAATLLQRLPPEALGGERQLEHLGAMRDILKWLQGKPALAQSAQAYLKELELVASGKALAKARASQAPAPQMKPLLLTPYKDPLSIAVPKQERWAGGIVGAGALQKKPAPVPEPASSALSAATAKRPVQHDKEWDDDWNDDFAEREPAVGEVLMQPRSLPTKARAKARNDKAKEATKKQSTPQPLRSEKRPKNFDEELAEARAELGIVEPGFDGEEFRQQNAHFESTAARPLPSSLAKSLAELAAGKVSRKADQKKIVNDLQLCADGNNPVALYRLGLLLLQGRFITRNELLAKEKLEMAGALAFSPGWLALARLYQRQGQQAHYETCLEQAAGEGHPVAVEEWSKVRSESEETPPEPPPQASLPHDLIDAISNLKKADRALQEKVVQQLRQLAAKDNAQAHSRLAQYYCDRNDEGDLARAEIHYRRAAELGDMDAWFDLALVHDRTDNKNPVEFMKCLEAAAKQDYADAFLILGQEYEAGIIVFQDRPRAFGYWLRGAQLNDTSCMFHLALCYLEGKGTRPDAKLGMRWLEAAAVDSQNARYKLAYLKEWLNHDFLPDALREQGLELLPKAMLNLLDKLKDPRTWANIKGETLRMLDRLANRQPPSVPNASALFQLALMREQGNFLEKDEALSLDLLKQAAALGLPAALFKMGQICFNNTALVQSKEWFEAAAYNGYAPAWNQLGMQCGVGDADGQQKAFGYWSRGAENGDKDCQFQAGLCWLEGRGTGINGCNAEKGLALIAAAAKSGHAQAVAKLRTLPVPVNFNDGYGESARNCPASVAAALKVIRDEDAPEAQRNQMLEGLHKDAMNKKAWAQHAMGRLLFEGKHVPQDLRAAASWFLKAQRKAPARSQYFLGELYRMGTEITPQDTSQALRHWRVGAADSDPDCLFRLGMAYLRGGNEGVEQSNEEARKWFQLARENGHTDANGELARL